MVHSLDSHQEKILDISNRKKAAVWHNDIIMRQRKGVKA